MSTPLDPASPVPVDRLFRDGGDMGAHMRAHDWDTTPLGPPHTWPAHLRTCVGLLLASKQPMLLGWTHDLISLYNDAYRLLLGTDKHPQALGARLADTFAGDAYQQLRPVYEALLQRGEAVAYEGAAVPLTRHGYFEEVFFDFSYTPVYGEGGVDGMFVACTEATERVLSARRTRTLAARVVGVQETGQVAEVVMAVLGDNPHDVPFARLYLPGPSGAGWHLAAHTGMDEDQPWPLEDVARTGQAHFAGNLSLSAGPWPEPVTEVATLPLWHSNQAGVLGVLVVGLSARKRLDDAYRHFLSLLAAQVTSALESAATTATLHAQRNELAARNRALEAFEEWSQDLTLDAEPYALIRRAQDLLHTLLSVDAALYYEREGDQWYVRSMRGEFGSDGLRQAHEAGLLHDETDNLRLPFETGEACYQDVDDTRTDGLADDTGHVSATAMLPLRTLRGVRGIFGLARFGRPGWSNTERTTFETVRRSLELALDRADQVAELAQERAALRTRTAELADANEELEAFTYSVSHDLRTPVRHVLGFNQLLRKQLGEDLDVKTLRYLRVVDEAAGRMNTLIDAMLDLSRTSRLPLRLRPVDLGELVGSVRLELEPDVLDREVEWHIQPLPLVSGDHDTLRQVMMNLLDNALKYTRTREVTRIEVWAEERPQEWVIAVRDNGVGFDPRYGGKLFGVFQRLHRAEDFEGTGVGLANVRRITARHGGQASAESRPGEGATFRFTLPRG